MSEVKIEYDKYGRTFIDITDETLTEEEKWEIRYALYKNMNESYRRLLNHLPSEEIK